ncbi:MAG: hypothetical protein HYY95_09645 [Candidatus Rokubacteria bacterium]|nr:hypothetical protein [Candidatus Rokubacteria bacterium]
MVGPGAGDLDLVERDLRVEDPAEHLLDFGLPAPRAEERERPVADGRWRLARAHQEDEPLGIGARSGRHILAGVLPARLEHQQAPGRLQARNAQRGRWDARARQGIEQLPLERGPDHAGQLGPQISRPHGADIGMPERFAVHAGGVGEMLGGEVSLVCHEQRDQLGVLGGAPEGARWEVGRAEARHPKLADHPPQRLGHLRLLGQVAEVGRHRARQLEQEPHDRRRPDAVRRRVDPALDQEGRRHRQRQIERRREAQVRPARALERQPLAERVPERMRRHEHPLRAGALGAAEISELGQEGVHQEASPAPAAARLRARAFRPIEGSRPGRALQEDG